MATRKNSGSKALSNQEVDALKRRYLRDVESVKTALNSPEAKQWKAGHDQDIMNGNARTMGIYPQLVADFEAIEIDAIYQFDDKTIIGKTNLTARKLVLTWIINYMRAFAALYAKRQLSLYITHDVKLGDFIDTKWNSSINMYNFGTKMLRKTLTKVFADMAVKRLLGHDMFDLSNIDKSLAVSCNALDIISAHKTTNKLIDAERAKLEVMMGDTEARQSVADLGQQTLNIQKISKSNPAINNNNTSI